MQDENVACHDLGKVSLERAVGCFGTPHLERATRFPNVPSRACDSLSNVPIPARMISSSKSVYLAVFFTIIISFYHSMPFIKFMSIY